MGPSEDRTADLVAITQALARYPHAVDDRDWAAFDLVFTDDVVCDMEAVGLGTTEGRAALVALFDAIDHPVAHHLVDPVIDLVGTDRATARSKWFVLLADRTGFAGIYDDRFERTGAGWRIQRRRVMPRQEGTRRPVPPYDLAGDDDPATRP